MFNKDAAFLKLIIGPMYSSKSSHLLSEINRYRYITENILVVNHVLDTLRHPKMNCGFIKTHNSKSWPAQMVEQLTQLYNLPAYKTAEIILIDEAQFYPDLFTFIKNELENTKKMFIVAGLNSDAHQNSFGDITKLIPLADDIVKLSAFCMICKNGCFASFTKKTKETFSESQIEIGAQELYIPVCRKHL